MKGSGCKNCPVNEWDCDAQYRGSRCASLRGAVELGDPLTNADRIRAMSDEELVDIYRCNVDCPPGKDYITCEKVGGTCKDCWVEWLQQPAEEVNK